MLSKPTLTIAAIVGFSAIAAALLVFNNHRSDMSDTSTAPAAGTYAPAGQASSGTDLPAPPVAAVEPRQVTHHGITLTDPYAWLKDDSYPEVDDQPVLDYLNAENAFYEAVMEPHKGLTEAIFEELKGRLKEDDASVPVKDGDWLYQWRFEEGAQYRKWYRVPVAGGAEQLILDEPALAEGKDYFRLGGLEVSPDGRLLAYSVDDDGSERFTLKVKDLTTGEVMADAIPNTIGDPKWSADGRTLLYLEVNENWRPFRVRAHVLGTPVADDRVLYEEQDGGFFVALDKTQSRDYLIIASGDHVTSEIRLLPASDPFAEPLLIAPREPGLEYYVDHAGDTLYIRTNDTHKNFRIATASPSAPGRDGWRELIAGSDRHYLRGITAFKDFLAIVERVDGLDQVRLRRHDGDEHTVAFPEAAYAAGLGANPEFDVDTVRLSYESMVTPDTVFDYQVASRTLITRKVQEIPSGYDAGQYVTERLLATARDGVQVPISIVYKKGFTKDGTRPVHLYAYGAYGYGMPPSFSTARLSLLDRGFAYAIAHIRGGDELGRQWYEDGKMFKRMNTFTDFIDAARHLVAEGYAAPGNVSASGGSAGGSLMGAVVNMAPETWRAVVAHVPFVDVLNTMLDTSLPLTPIEWPEWGNPIESREAFDYIRSYSPYDNVAAQDYPPIMVTAGLNDPRVTYWEPAKWTARLRATKTDDNLLVLKTNMGAGHGGKSGRFRRLYETAEEYTFLLMAFGLLDQS